MEPREQARQLYEQGKSLKDIAERLGVKDSTVRSWKSRYGWGKNPADVATLRTSATQRGTADKKQRRAVKTIAKTIADNDELSDLEKQYCVYYVQCNNKVKAAVMLNYYKNYNSARQNGWRMYHKPAVQKEIARLREIQRSAAILDARDFLDRLGEIAFADLADFVEWGQEEVPVIAMHGPVQVEDPETGEKVPLTKTVNTVRLKESSEVDSALLSEVKLGRDGASVKIDRLKAMEMYIKLTGLDAPTKHRIEYDNKRLELEEKRQSAGSEDALERLDSILAGVKQVMRHD